MRKHPDVIALIAIGFALFASIGLESAMRRLQQEGLRMQPLILQSERFDIVVESAVKNTLRDVLRNLLTSRH